MMEERYTLIKNLRLIDAQGKKTDGCDLLFLLKEGTGTVVDIGKNLPTPRVDGTQVVNAHGKTACPAFTDLRCSIPDPGFVHRETMSTGLSAAVTGGYCRVLLAPTSDPLPDNGGIVREEAEKCKKMWDCRVERAVPLTLGGKGETLCNFEELQKAGAAAVSACA